MRVSRNIALFLLIFSLLLPSAASGLTLDEERKLGRETFVEIVHSVPIFSDPYISVYVDSMRARLENSANLPFPIVLTIINSKEANAFATFGGYVYITTGLMAMCTREEELAGVIAHEFAHIGKRHIAKRIEKQKYLNAAMLGTLLLSAIVGAPTASAALLNAGMGATQALSLKYSRDDEEEADRVGTEIAYRAGYGGLGIAEFLKVLRSAGGDRVLPQYLLTHPYHEERIIRIEAAWAGKGPTYMNPFFPYVAARNLVMQKAVSPGVEETIVNKYRKDPADPVLAYGAVLVLASRGETEKALGLAKEMGSPFRNQLLGEILVNAQRFDDAVAILKDDPSPASRYFLAKAYEGQGRMGLAYDELQGLLSYSRVFPEIYYRLGMVAGRAGNEAKGFEYLGRYYVELGRYDLAKTNLEKAVSRYGINSKEAQELLALLDRIKS